MLVSGAPYLSGTTGTTSMTTGTGLDAAEFEAIVTSSIPSFVCCFSMSVILMEIVMMGSLPCLLLVVSRLVFVDQ